MTESVAHSPGGIRKALQQGFQRWVRRRIPPGHQITLDHHNIFILPSRQGLGFCFMLGLMFIGAINYEASLAFALVFLLLGMFLLSILYTFRNLSGLQLTGRSGNAVFAGEEVPIEIVLERTRANSHENVRLFFPGSQVVHADLIDQQESRLTLHVKSARRGYFQPGRLVIETFFPLGLCRAWSLVDMDLKCLIFPRPVPCDLDWLMANSNLSGQLNIQQGQDDFHGLRDYQHGDSLRHVAWKNYARGQGMFTKVYASHVDERVWLDWDMFPDMDTEERLSRLSYCVLQLENRQVDYGLRLPGTEIAPSRGEQHYQQVMTALALFGLPGEGS